MNIPNLPHEKPIDSNGQWTATWNLWFQQLITMLQQKLSDEGCQLSLRPTDIIMQLNKPINTGKLIYDAEIQAFKGNVNGTFKVINMS